MKTLLSVNITESQEGEFPQSGSISWGHFRRPRFHSGFTFFRGPTQSPRRTFAFFSRACWLL